MIITDFKGIQLRLREDGDKTSVFDPIRKKWVMLTPEEHVRQYMIQYLTANMHYPAGLIAVEKAIEVGKLTKRFDIVVYNGEHKPWMLAECKAPGVPISEAVLHQLLGYQSVIQSRYWLLTNGHQTFCADAADPKGIRWLKSLPAYDSSVIITA
jgi:hypothetical protein